MKKLLLSLLVLVPATALLADTQFDSVNNRFCSYPDTADIDQNEYHNLFIKYYKIIQAWSASYGVNFFWQTDFEKAQLANLLNNKAATDNLENRFKTYFAILGTQHSSTANRFMIDVTLLNIMGGFNAISDKKNND